MHLPITLKYHFWFTVLVHTFLNRKNALPLQNDQEKTGDFPEKKLHFQRSYCVQKLRIFQFKNVMFSRHTTPFMGHTRPQPPRLGMVQFTIHATEDSVFVHRESILLLIIIETVQRPVSTTLGYQLLFCRNAPCTWCPVRGGGGGLREQFPRFDAPVSFLDICTH